jgi:hypothetical protein
MPLQASGTISHYNLYNYWVTKGVTPTAYDLNYYRGRAHYVGIQPSDSAANATFPAGVISLSNFYNKTPVGEGAAVNCNCNCDCGGGSGCGSSCFPAGSLVLMGNGFWREITQLRLGDLLLTPSGPQRIERLIKTTLGDRRMMSFREDRSMKWSEEHAFLARRHGRSWLWSMAPHALEQEFVTGILGGHLSKPAWRGQVGEIEDIAHLDGFVLRKPMQLSLIHI